MTSCCSPCRRLDVVVFFVVLIVGIHGDDECLVADKPWKQCSTKTVFIIDTTTWMDRTQITEEFTFLRSEIVRRLSFGSGEQVSFMSFGTGFVYTNNVVDNLVGACLQLTTLQTNSQQMGQSDVPLISALQSFQLAYASLLSTGDVPAILFTGSNSTSDIKDAAVFAKSNLPNVKFSVISYNAGDFSSFPAVSWWSVNAPLSTYDGLAPCLLQRACDDNDQCNIDKPVTTSTSFKDRSPHCNCDESAVWNDVMVLFDCSRATTAQGLQELLYHFQSDMPWFTVRKAGTTDPLQHMRVGIILYDSNATLAYPLGSLDNDGLNDIMDFNQYYRSIDYTNIEAAVRMALDQFETTAHRPNAKKVILIYGTTYRPNGVDDPVQIIETFKEDGGVIIIYDYIETHGAPSLELESIGSNGFATNSAQDVDGSYVKDALCRANCFCPPNYLSYSNDFDGTPNGGCFHVAPSTSNFQLTTRSCSLFNAAILAVDDQPDKLKFLRNQFPNPTQFWIGLHYDTVWQAWIATDNETLGPDDFSRWGADEPKQKTCVYTLSQFDVSWLTGDCRNSLAYVCEAPPCDSTHYCS